MNLKRLRGIYAVALITIAAALFAGCMNSMAGSVDGSSRMATLQLSATGIPEEYAEEFAAYCARQNSASSRSILPNDPFDIGGIGSGSGQSDGLVLVLTGKSETGMTFEPKEVTLDTGTTVDDKTVYGFNEIIALESMSWALVLTTYKNYNATTKTGDAVLRGYCSVDLRNGSGTATFVMGIAGLITPGSVSISGTIVDEDGLAKSYTMGIYRKDNIKDVGDTEQIVASFDVSADGTFTFTANGKEVPPGTYLYTMIFYNADKEVVGSFTDTIVINPGNALKKDNLVIDVIGRKPTEPADLKAYLVDGSEPSDGRTYNVKIQWTQAKYVTNYELNVVESPTNGTDFSTDSNGMIEGGMIYGMASMDKAATKTVVDFPGSAVFGTDSSSMMYGDTSCVLELETGKVYEIQLRARSYYGTSEWVDREGGDSGVTGLTAYAAPATQRINRMLITYNLNGGKLKVGGTTDTYENVPYSEYKCWTTDDALIAIKSGDGEPTSGEFTLKKGTSAFVEWLLEDGTAINADEDETSTRGDAVEKYTYKNVVVTASFGNEVSANVSQEAAKKDVDRTDIIIKYGISGDITQDPVVNANGVYTLTKSGSDGTSNKIQIELKNTGTKYTNVKFEVKKQSEITYTSVSQTTAGVCQIDTASYQSGRMYVMVTADTENAKSMSQTLIFDLE